MGQFKRSRIDGRISMDADLPPRRAKAKSSPAYPQQSSSVRTPQGNATSSPLHLETVRRYLLKLTPIEGKDLLPTARNPFCTLVLLDKDLKELKGEKRRTPVGKVHPSSSTSPMWSPLKAAVLRSLESANESNMPLGIGVAAAAEEYTFGTTVNLRKAKYVLVKCKDKGQVQTEDLGRLLLALDDLDTSGMELTSWYDLQMHTGMKRVQGKLRLSCRIIREPSRKQLWLAAEQMRSEISANIKDHYLYLKCHPMSFSGRHATDWMLRHGLNRPMKGGIACSTEEEALLIGQCWLRAGILTAISSFGGTTGATASYFQNTSWKYYRFGVDHLDPFIRRDKQRECQCVLELEELVHDVEYEGEEDMAASGASSPLPSSASTQSLQSGTLSSRGMQLPPAPSSVTAAPSTRSTAPPVTKHESATSGQRRSLVSSDPASRSSLSQKKAPPPLTIDDFELLRVLGTGTFGRVVSARHRASNQVFAIKIVHKFGMDDASKATAKRERDVLMEATHPFVASLHFAFQNEDKLYMGMEYLNGGDLRYHIMAHHQQQHAHHIAGSSGANTLTPSRIKLYAAELVAALAHLHSLHIIYRDLKPENVLVARDGHVKLVDFGLSKVTRTASKTLAGSPEYIAPEVLVHSKKASARSDGDGYTDACDWWSLGVLIYELYVGRTPFHDSNQAIMYRNIAEGPVYIPTEWGADVTSLLRGLIERDVSKRLGGSTNENPVPFDLMNHPYFGDINWDILQAKGGPTPEWVPDPDEVYVDDEFRSVIPVDTPEWRMLDEVDRAREHVDGFSFRPTEVFKVQP